MKGIKPEKVKQILAEQGTEVTVEEAQTILTFMTDLATIELKGIFENESIVSIAQEPKKTSIKKTFLFNAKSNPCFRLSILKRPCKEQQPRLVQ